MIGYDMSLQLILMGPQGSGKGTVAAILTEKLGVSHISMGDLLRETVYSKSSLGREIQSFIDQGELVPLEVIKKMLLQRLSEKDAQQGFILDGFPRDKAQAEVLDQIAKITAVIVLETSREVSLQRLGGRVQCRNCGAIYNLITKPPKKSGICDVCQSELYQREDDKEVAILKRLDIYESETKPLIETYGSLVIRIDTSKLTPEEVAEIILRSL
jgi:adenylate kinase